MTSTNKKIRLLAFALVALAAAMTGCQKQDPASVVQRRAAERWNLLVSHEPIKAYDYLSPGYRATHTLDQYVAFIATTRLAHTLGIFSSVEEAQASFENA